VCLIRLGTYYYTIVIMEWFPYRYKFLAFDFYENVEVTKENCRLLLIRLKMEGWLIGKSKVFLRYYNEEYLSRYVQHLDSWNTMPIIDIWLLITHLIIRIEFSVLYPFINVNQHLKSSQFFITNRCYYVLNLNANFQALRDPSEKSCKSTVDAPSIHYEEENSTAVDKTTIW